MGASGRHKIPGSETKCSVIHSAAGNIAIGNFALVLSALHVLWWCRGPRWVPLSAVGCISVEEHWAICKTHHCPRGRHHLIPENGLGNEWPGLAFFALPSDTQGPWWIVSPTLGWLASALPEFTICDTRNRLNRKAKARPSEKVFARSQCLAFIPSSCAASQGPALSSPCSVISPYLLSAGAMLLTIWSEMATRYVCEFMIWWSSRQQIN